MPRGWGGLRGRDTMGDGDWVRHLPPPTHIISSAWEGKRVLVHGGPELCYVIPETA